MQLSERDERRLIGVHPDLIKVVERAAELVIAPELKFFVLEGLRTQAQQVENVRKGVSQTLRSRHITGHAVDLMPWHDRDGDSIVDADEIDWKNLPSFKAVATLIKRAARDVSVPIEWGGDWRSFYDGPHFQLPEDEYPVGG